MDDAGIPAGRITVTADQLAVLAAPEVRRAVASLVPATVMLGEPAEIPEGSGVWAWEDWRFTADDIALVLYLLDNPAVLDAICAEAPDAS